MARNPTSSDLTGPCEKFFGAITGTNALKAMRRASLRPQTPKPNIPAPGTLPKYDPSAKALISLQPQSQPPKPDISKASLLTIHISAPPAKAHPGLGNGESAELVPIMFLPADDKMKSKVEITVQGKSFPVALIASEMAPELQVAPQKDGTAKAGVGIGGQAVRAKPNTEPAPPAHASALNMAHPGNPTPGPGNLQIGKVIQKTKLEMQMPTSNQAIGQIHAQGAKPPQSWTPLQDKPKQVVKQGKKEEGDKDGHHNIDHRCSAFIDRAKIKIRTTSDVGKSNMLADSSDTKMKGKTASIVGGGSGRSASFKHRSA